QQDRTIQSNLKRQSHKQTRNAIFEAEARHGGIPELARGIALEDVEEEVGYAPDTHGRHDDDGGEVEAGDGEEAAVETED
ncbi:MAG: hypothetical protein Q9174_007217, partial [Haloplaca sp. 1 TL-2023]